MALLGKVIHSENGKSVFTVQKPTHHVKQMTSTETKSN